MNFEVASFRALSFNPEPTTEASSYIPFVSWKFRSANAASPHPDVLESASATGWRSFLQLPRSQIAIFAVVSRMDDTIDLRSFFNEEEFSDVLVKVGTVIVTHLKCHKIILSSKSKYLADLIGNAEFRSVSILGQYSPIMESLTSVNPGWQPHGHRGG